MGATPQAAQDWLSAARDTLSKGFQIVRPTGHGPATEDEWRQLERPEWEKPRIDGVLLDAFTASMLVQVHDALTPPPTFRCSAGASRVPQVTTPDCTATARLGCECCSGPPVRSAAPTAETPYRSQGGDA